MVRTILSIAFFIFPALVLQSQPLPDKAADSPLNTAIYLLSKDSHYNFKLRLMQILCDLDRNDELFDLIDKTKTARLFRF